MTTTALSTTRRLLALGLAAIALLGLPAGSAHAERYPSRPVRVIVPLPCGGANDAVARVLAPRLEKVLSQTVVVECRPGGGGIVGATAVARAKPDGHTLLQSFPAPIAINTTPGDPNGMVGLDRQEPIAIVAELEAVFTVNANVPATDLKSFIAYTEARQGKARLGITAPGNFPALASQKFFIERKVQGRRVNYPGTAPALKDLLGGHIDGHLDVLAGSLPHIRSGSLRALAVAGKARSPYLPDVPTSVEQGYPELIASAWFALAAPAGTPRPVIDTLSRAVLQITSSADYQEAVTTLGALPRTTTPAEAREFIHSEQQRAAQIVAQLPPPAH
ncbi:Bug family tripartite tricarboxylate transporter substrate binding protein [Caldimonas thermodepolymerans]|uniref:Bug family tripartite tricarboxylate transporter substrate binding protein n=1 Tax=Caldimonas thermodepolymerans TaxID=215580 RepID=UPI00223578DB|nr:tripartite tricarboxylate transporter substrate binding protein [Caldimonas thermodepolymerans]UZG42679.1 tripartite tricarboxylate transporter substrate binding protein [Caldimonas thermodepolymerans]